MQNKILGKGLVIGIIALFVSVSVLSSVSSKDVAITDDKILEDNTEIEPLDTCRGIFKILGGGEEGYILSVKKSGPGIFFRHVEILCMKSFDIEGYCFSQVFPFIKSFYKTTCHIVAPRCFVTWDGMLYPGYEMIKAFAIGDIEWE